VVDLEVHAEVVGWLDTLDDAEWDRAVVVFDRLVALGSSARMPLSRNAAEACAEQYP
jgi:hypothetical protein